MNKVEIIDDMKRVYVYPVGAWPLIRARRRISILCMRIVSATGRVLVNCLPKKHIGDSVGQSEVEDPSIGAHEPEAQA